MNPDPHNLRQQHPDWEVRIKKSDSQPMLVEFGGGGHMVHFAARRDGDLTVSKQTESGYDTPEVFFNIEHWRYYDYLHARSIEEFEGVPFIDKRKSVETPEGYKMAICGPMVDVGLKEGQVDRLPEPSDMLKSGLMAQMDRTYAAMLGIHKVTAATSEYGALDSVDVKTFMRMWKDAGATVGYIRGGQFVPE